LSATAGARRLAVLGRPVAHSLSPAIQNAALEALGLAPQWRYEAIEVAPDEFEDRVRQMPAEGFVGANVTVPHKLAALALADVRSEVAREIGAANTLSFDEAGRIRADNTDAAGLTAAIGRPLSGADALVLGAGGAARAVVWGLEREGATVKVWNRTISKAAEHCAGHGGTVEPDPDPGEYDVIVNSTAVGLDREDPFAELPLAPGDFLPGQLIVDLVYGEQETALLSSAREGGAETVDGIEVLVHQGAASLRIWTGQLPPLDVMRAVARG
jgi:shikimate dehydrogenase